MKLIHIHVKKKKDNEVNDFSRKKKQNKTVLSQVQGQHVCMQNNYPALA